MTLEKEQNVQKLVKKNHLGKGVTKYFINGVDTVKRSCYHQFEYIHISYVEYKIDLSDGQFSERCDVDGSFFNSDTIPIIFGKA